MSLALGILVLVFLGIALRQVFSIPLKIWHFMCVGACLVLLTGQITILSAMKAVDWNVILFLWGMFVLGQGLEESGLLSQFVARFLQKGYTHKRLVVVIVFGLGICSSLLMNDTLAIIGTPILLKVARQQRIKSSPLLLGLAFSITIGSVLSPIGNPQNLFIAMDVPISNSFVVFLKYLGIPTLINLTLLYFFILYLIRKERGVEITVKEESPYHPCLMRFCSIAMGMVFMMIFYNIIASFSPMPFIPFIWIALIPAFFLLVFGSQRKKLLIQLDWHTLLFFIAMFILMRAVWETSSLKEHLTYASTSILGIMTISTTVSQCISNVPLVALYLPLLKNTAQGVIPYMALVAGSTIAGNFLIFGAASNLIIIQNAEKKGEKGISFWGFAKYGIPLSFLNLGIYWFFLAQVT